MNLLVVVTTELFFLLNCPAPEWLADVSVGIFTTDHESNLTRWVGRNCCVGIFDDREDLSTRFLERRNQRKVEPLIFSYDHVSKT